MTNWSPSKLKSGTQSSKKKLRFCNKGFLGSNNGPAQWSSTRTHLYRYRNKSNQVCMHQGEITLARRMRATASCECLFAVIAPPLGALHQRTGFPQRLQTPFIACTVLYTDLLIVMLWYIIWITNVNRPWEKTTTQINYQKILIQVL
jgi:hypothetical protein